MADTSRDALLSAAWILTRHVEQPGSTAGRSDTSGPSASQVVEVTSTREAVGRLITEYLSSPARISSGFPS